LRDNDQGDIFDDIITWAEWLLEVLDIPGIEAAGDLSDQQIKQIKQTLKSIKEGAETIKEEFWETPIPAEAVPPAAQDHPIFEELKEVRGDSVAGGNVTGEIPLRD
jgi:hypothetical protein